MTEKDREIQELRQEIAKLETENVDLKLHIRSLEARWGQEAHI